MYQYFAAGANQGLRVPLPRAQARGRPGPARDAAGALPAARGRPRRGAEGALPHAGRPPRAARAAPRNGAELSWI